MFFRKINEKLDFIIEKQGKDLDEYKRIVNAQEKQIKEYQLIIANMQKTSK